MDQNWFFKWVWRFNGLVAAGLLISLLVSLARPYIPVEYGGTKIAEDEPYATAAPPLTTDEPELTVPNAAPLPRSYHLRPDYFRGTRPVAVFVLEFGAGAATSSDPYPTLSYPSSTTDYGGVAVNYLIVDPATRSSRWLFPTNNQSVVSAEYVTASMGISSYPTAAEPLLAVLYHVWPHDPARAMPLVGKTETYASTPDGSKLVKLFDNSDMAPVSSYLSPEHILVTRTVDGHAKAAIVSLADLKQVVESDLTALTPKYDQPPPGAKN